MRITVWFLALSVLACAMVSARDAGVAAASTTAQRARSKSVYAIRVGRDKKRLVLIERGRSHALDLADKVDAARIEDATLLFADRRGEFLYLLLSVCGSSKSKPDDRQCGAGVECNLVWVKLGDDWKVGDSKSERYESCWQPITSDDGPKVTGRRLVLVLEDFSESVRREVNYDADRPEEGLTFKSSAIPKD